MKNKVSPKNVFVSTPDSEHAAQCQAILTKIRQIQEITQNTATTIDEYRRNHLFTNGEIMTNTATLVELNQILDATRFKLDTPSVDLNAIVSEIQKVVDRLSVLFSNYGAPNIHDILVITFGQEFANSIAFPLPALEDKYALITKYVRPIGYKIYPWKRTKTVKSSRTNTLCKDKLNVDLGSAFETYNNIECLDVDVSTTMQFLVKVHGIRVIIHNDRLQKTIVIKGMCTNVPLDILGNRYLEERRKAIRTLIEESSAFPKVDAYKVFQILTLKDMLICGDNDVYKKNIGISHDSHFVSSSDIGDVSKKFLEMNLYTQRNILLNIFASNNDMIQYVAYILYDCLIINTTETLDAHNQIVIYDSFPWKIKNHIKDATKNTVKYSSEIAKKYDVSPVSLEQKIYLMNLPENVKERAFARLKEVKGKPDESSAKARQYLEGLLKIPFGKYRAEPILGMVANINSAFTKILGDIAKMPHRFDGSPMSPGTKYSNIEIMQYIRTFSGNLPSWLIRHFESIPSTPLKAVNKACDYIQTLTGESYKKNRQERLNYIRAFLEKGDVSISDKCLVFDLACFSVHGGSTSVHSIYHDLEKVSELTDTVKGEMSNIVANLDKSIYGHNNAKNQILKIIGQWMNGKTSGYCFGFEGSPGIGKTSLAKTGISKCLIDEDGTPRPFAFIALGGSCNGATLEGHNYTYVNALWGRIVDILMETKCMNPIIYIDELDKVSNTEHGKEIIGILMHLIDSTQNDVFQDKYYSGINIDLSKVLFIFSYNDPSKIDSVLLDRIHRIKFENLSTADKLVVVRKHILPEICERMGFSQDLVILGDSIVEYLILTYTAEPGIRKLKEILFDIYGEINIEMLKCDNERTYPIELTVPILENHYMKQYVKVEEKKINPRPDVGYINGLWANALGMGGITPIETSFCPANVLLELKLTGLQGDVMKESMNVAKNVAWSRVSDKIKAEWLATFEKTQNGGIHIHCPEGGVPKDGPSAGAAITCAIYSLLMGRQIKNTVAITGEIDLRGNITAIGGLEMKILGGIRAGVKTFIFPEANARDYTKFLEKYESITVGLEFIQVSHIDQVFSVVFV